LSESFRQSDIPSFESTGSRCIFHVESPPSSIIESTPRIRTFGSTKNL